MNAALGCFTSLLPTLELTLLSSTFPFPKTFPSWI